jgi:ribosomal protein S18 acetylase RimI-like enzyme
MDHSIRILTKKDYNDMKDMFYTVFPPVETGFHEAFKYRVKNLSKGIYVDSDEPGPRRKQLLAGFILCDVYGEEFEMIKINYIVIHPMYQSQGFGSILLQHILGICKRMEKKVMLIPVMKDHIVRWYRKNGFRISRVTDASNGGKFCEMCYTH